jgi:hypothetical protein
MAEGLPMIGRLMLRTGIATAVVALTFAATGLPTRADDAAPGDVRIARNLATMLQSARAVVSAHQADINDASKGDKGLTGQVVLEQAIANYQKATGNDPRSIDPTSFEGRLIKAQMDSVVEVMDANQDTINQQGVGFKGFIPATFARLVNEAFSRRVGEEATVKVTAPPQLVRNRQARPDDWEVAAIKDYLQKADWPKGQMYSGVESIGGKPMARVMVPEYYAPSCLSCHGEPKGELDITGYPKEGGHEGDLGGVISIELAPQ